MNNNKNTAIDHVIEILDRALLNAEEIISTSVDGVDDFLAKISTELWRLNKKIAGAQNKMQPAEIKRISMHIDSMRDSLENLGVELQDHTNMAFNAGLSLKVIAYQQLSYLRKEQIIETVKPSIYRDGNCIQMGEVIVGTPIDAE